MQCWESGSGTFFFDPELFVSDPGKKKELITNYNFINFFITEQINHLMNFEQKASLPTSMFITFLKLSDDNFLQKLRVGLESELLILSYPDPAN